MTPITVELEMGPKRRVFAQAQGWVGWCRAGRDADAALARQIAVGLRYAQVATLAGLPLALPRSTAELEVVERVAGTAVTDFGAPSVLFASDRRALDEEEIDRLSRLLQACWATFDATLRRIPESERDVKPDRGRAPFAMRLHVVETDRMHLSAFGPSARPADRTRIDEQEAAVREQMLARLRALPRGEEPAPLRRYGFTWTPVFAVRRSGWHALDHAWELADRASTQGTESLLFQGPTTATEGDADG